MMQLQVYSMACYKTYNAFSREFNLFSSSSLPLENSSYKSFKTIY